MTPEEIQPYLDIPKVPTLIGSVLGGATVDLLAGHDLKVIVSSVIGDNDVNLVAKSSISVDDATNQFTKHIIST